MIKKLNRLTLDTYMEYGNRKVAGRISLFVDISSENVYMVPRDIEHIDFAREIQRKGLINNLEKLIPTPIDTTYDNKETLIPKINISGVLTGVSGLEIKAGIRHTKVDLESAHKITWDLIYD